MRAQQCPTCGRPADPTQVCPHCGAAPGDFAAELARIEREIAEIAAKDMEFQKQRTVLSRKLQAAMHRRALLANAQDERTRHAVTRTKRQGRRRPPRVPPAQRRMPQPQPDQSLPDQFPTGRFPTDRFPVDQPTVDQPTTDQPSADQPSADLPAAGRSTTGPSVGPPAGPTRGRPTQDPSAQGRPAQGWSGRGQSGRGQSGLVGPPPGRSARGWPARDGATEPFADDAQPGPAAPGPGWVHPPTHPEASTRSVQNIMLVLGALLLGVGAVVFAGMAISTLGPLGRAAILISATVLMLAAPLPVARRGLTATAETIAAVGLLLVPLDGYALWTLDGLRTDVPGHTYAGFVFLVATAIAAGYARTSGLRAPRYAALLALQPVLPLLAYGWIGGYTGWALVLAAVAGLNIALARWLPAGLDGWAGSPSNERSTERAEGRAGGGPSGRSGERRGGRAADRAGGPPIGTDWPEDEPPPVVRRPEGAPEEPDAVVTVAGSESSLDIGRETNRDTSRDTRLGTGQGTRGPHGQSTGHPAVGFDTGSGATSRKEITGRAPADPGIIDSTATDGTTITGTTTDGTTTADTTTDGTTTAATGRSATDGTADGGIPGVRTRPATVRTVGAVPVSAPAGAGWLRDAAWALHGLASVGALVCAVAAMVSTDALAGTTAAAAALLLAALVGMAGTALAGRATAMDLAAGVLTLAAITAIGRVAAIALPGRAMLVIAASVAAAGIAVRALPQVIRRGPQIASSIALAVVGVAVAASAMRAAAAPVRAAAPLWHAELSGYEDLLSAAVSPVGWQLVASALLLTIAAALVLPADVRRESTVAAASLTILSAPASLGLAWYLGPWVLLVGATAIAVAGLSTPDLRAARAHIIGAGVTGLLAAGAAAARPATTAAVLTGTAVAGLLVVAASRLARRAIGRESTAHREIGDWAAGGAALAFPGAVTAMAVAQRASTAEILAAGFLAACAPLACAALLQVSRRELTLPLLLGPGLGALAVTAASFGAPRTTATDAWVGALLLAAASALFLAPSIDSGRRADRSFDGADVAAAAVTGAILASLTRAVSLSAPGAELLAGAGLVLLVAVAVRALPEGWRRGPALGIMLGGTVIVAIAGATVLRGGLQVLAAPGPIWHGDLSGWPTTPDPNGWQAPMALLLLALAAAVALPRPIGYDASAVCVGLATIGVPVALGLPWWSPVLVDGAVAAGYAAAAVVARDPRAARARAALAIVVALHGVGAGLVRPWTTVAALLQVTLLGAVIAVLARALVPLLRREPSPRPDDTLVDLKLDAGPPETPPHLIRIGGMALAGALLAAPGTVAAAAAASGRTADVVLAGALAASSVGLAAVAAARRRIRGYLPYATVGVAGGATITAIAAIPTGVPSGVYASAAALLGVLAELSRWHAGGASDDPPAVRRWPGRLTGPVLRQRAEVFTGPTRWALRPPMGALVAAALPAALALVSIAPALAAALVDPFEALRHVWQGPPELLRHPQATGVDGTGVATALLLTITAAMAAIGFGGGRTAQAFPVVLPGLAATLLITPIALGLPWPAATLAALSVFTLCMLGVALTPPPPDGDKTRPLRVTRQVAFVIGLAAGGAGLAGSLATRPLTLFTLGGATAVGLTAGIGGRSQTARILGWLFGAVSGQLFVLTVGLVAGFDVRWSAFGVLGVGAVLVLFASALPRLRRPEAAREAAAVEWSGYAAALLSLALVADSAPHVAAVLAGWGAVLGAAAGRPNRRPGERSVLFWVAIGCEIVAWWILMVVADVALPEAYTLPFAVLALLVGLIELRRRPELGSWVAFGPALVAAFLPTLVIVLTTENQSMRQVLLLLGAVATLVAGSTRRQRAPVVIGATVTAITAVHALFQFGPWPVIVLVGVVLIAFGASNEKRRRDLRRLRGALTRMR